MPLIPETWRDQQQVNTTTSGTQDQPDIVQLANGNILVAWTSTATTGVADQPGDDIVGQLYDPLGNRIGSEFRLNINSTADNEQHPSIAAMPDGGFVVAYWDRNISNDGGSNIRLDRFNANGTFHSGELIRNDTSTPAAPNLSDPVVAVSSATSILTVYEEINASSVTRLVGRIYNPSTDTLGAEINILSSTVSITEADIAVLSNGNYVIAANRGGTDSGIAYRIVNATGGNVLAFTQVSGTASNGFTDGDPSVTALSNGNFVISWTNTDATDTDVQWRLFNAGGTQIDTGDVAVGSGTNNNNEPTVVGLTDGSFVVIYDNDEAGQLQVERFSGATGNSMGIFTIAATAPSQISATSLADGRFAVTWVTNNGSGEIAMEILDTRDNANATPVYTPENWQVGTIGDDVFAHAGTADIVHGYDGNDTITAGDFGGAVEVYGDDGNDTIIVLSGFTDDLYSGGSSITGDTIDWSGSGVNGATFNLSTGLASNGTGSEVMTNFEHLIGTSGNDSIIGDGFTNRLTGGAGNDTLEGGSGTDTLIGGTGNDVYINPLGDTITEIVGQGFDTVITNASFSLITHPGIERVELTGATPSFLRGNDSVNTLIGNSGSNTLDGFAGNDTILGLGGRDTITGGLGRDTIAPGLERDTVRWTAVQESTGVNRDTVSEFVFSSAGPYESLDFHVIPTALRATVTTGSLSEATFDINLTAAITGARLGAGQAVLFDPNGGDLNIAGHIYLIVDANGIGGYQANEDYVVQFTSTYGTLTLANFI